MRAQPDGMREHLDWKGPSGLGPASGQPDSPAGGGVRVRSAIAHHQGGPVRGCVWGCRGGTWLCV